MSAISDAAILAAIIIYSFFMTFILLKHLYDQEILGKLEELRKLLIARSSKRGDTEPKKRESHGRKTEKTVSPDQDQETAEPVKEQPKDEPPAEWQEEEFE